MAIFNVPDNVCFGPDGRGGDFDYGQVRALALTPQLQIEALRLRHEAWLVAQSRVLATTASSPSEKRLRVRLPAPLRARPRRVAWSHEGQEGLAGVRRGRVRRGGDARAAGPGGHRARDGPARVSLALQPGLSRVSLTLLGIYVAESLSVSLLSLSS